VKYDAGSLIVVIYRNGRKFDSGAGDLVLASCSKAVNQDTLIKRMMDGHGDVKVRSTHPVHCARNSKLEISGYVAFNLCL